MAMLAEPRRRQKISSDPRNTSWSNDDNKFGHKLMEKMGWSRGKGLGAKEDGNTQHITVSVKNDNRGVGCSKKYADNWIAHQDDFNALLADLGENHNDGKTSEVEKKVLSLEQRSRSTRGRVHYQKFTKGKDLSLKSENDLDCVFGKRKTQSSTSTPQNQSESNSDSEEKSHGIVTVTSTDSVQDYFNKKMADKLKKLKENTEDTKSLEEMEENNIDKACSDNEFKDQGSEKKTKSKRKRKYKDAVEEQSSVNEEPLVKKSKKKKKNSVNENDTMKNEEDAVEEKSSVSEEPHVKKSKKKKKTSVNENDNMKNDEDAVEVKSSVSEESYVKTSKKKKKNSVNENDNMKKEEETVEVNYNKVYQKSMKGQDQIKSDAVDNNNVGAMVVVNDEGSEKDGEVKEKKKTKKKTKKKLKKDDDDVPDSSRVIFNIGDEICNEEDSHTQSEKTKMRREPDEQNLSCRTEDLSSPEDGDNLITSGVPQSGGKVMKEANQDVGKSDLKYSSDTRIGTSMKAVDENVSVKKDLRQLDIVRAHSKSFSGANVQDLKGYIGYHVSEEDIKRKMSNKMKR